MTTKEYLNAPYELHLKIKDNIQKLESYKEMAESISAIELGEKIIESRNTDAPFVKYLEKIDELEKNIAKDNEQLSALMMSISVEIDKVADPMEQVVLSYRYLMFMNIPMIANKMGYSKRWVQKIHSKALKNLKLDTPVHP